MVDGWTVSYARHCGDVWFGAWKTPGGRLGTGMGGEKSGLFVVQYILSGNAYGECLHFDQLVRSRSIRCNL